MRTKLVKRHYCDHCNKGGMVAKSMEQHERTCLKNPRRACFLCEEDRETPTPMAELIAAFDHRGLDGTGGLREAARDCPACTLAAILQSMPKNPDQDDYVQYDYKTEKDRWYSERRQPMAF